jgi:hypothetical protein
MTDLRPITLAGDPAAVRTLPGTSLPGPGAHFCSRTRGCRADRVLGTATGRLR